MATIFGLFGKRTQEETGSADKKIVVNHSRCPQNHVCPSLQVCPVGALS